MKILIVDDSPDLVEALKLGFKLQWPECQVVSAENGQKALEVFPPARPDIILLDIAMPGMDGFEVLRRIREVSDVPVIMLTVKGEELDKVRALELGADDYITKPFSSLELMARMKAVLRRVEVGTAEVAPPPFKGGDLTIDYATHIVSVQGRPVKLTWTEYRLLCILARYPNKALSRETLLARVWGDEYRGESDLLKVYIKRLRDKIEDDSAHPRYIITERGWGYKLAVP